jgi:hypothetical protein
MAKKDEYKLRRMQGQNPKDEGMYRFRGSGMDARMHPTDAKVSRDINRRDREDIARAEEKARRGEPLSKMERMAYKDAIERQNRLGARYSSSLSYGDTGKGYTLKEGAETRERLKKRYGVAEKAKGGKVKKMAKGGKVTRGDGCATKGKTKGRMV